MSTSPSIRVVVSIDTEEDNWVPTRTGLTTRNVRQLPRLARFFERLGVRATYFTTYPVAADREATRVLRDVLAGGRAELGAHLHPWNTPPMGDYRRQQSTMLKNFPMEVQAAKLGVLTTRLEDAFHRHPIVFRAGRFGVGQATVRVLARAGYRVDSSVTPFFSWEEADDGPSFVGAPTGIYRLSGREDVRVPSADGPIVELPISVGYTHVPVAAWLPLARILGARGVRSLRLGGVASRLHVTRRTLLSPETSSGRDMLSVSRLLVRAGAAYLHLFFHSSSLVPGLNPFVASEPELERLYSTFERYLEGLAKLAHLSFRTVGEAARELAPPASGPAQGDWTDDEPRARHASGMR